MTHLDVSLIRRWHSRVYFDAANCAAAWELREAVIAHFSHTVEMGRFHERPVGPHPQSSHQVALAPRDFAEVVGWLALNRGSLDVFIHPNTDNELRDHRAYQLDLRAVGG
jgi:DOPA 4,5-dioxygenase